MKVSVEKVFREEEEQVILACMEMTSDFQDIKEYVLAKGEKLVVYQEKNQMLLSLSEILYIEAVGERVFAYTKTEVYEIKLRLYEVEERISDSCFIRCSKSVLLNIRNVLSLRPALNGRFLATMTNREEVMISRQYAKAVKKVIMEEL